MIQSTTRTVASVERQSTLTPEQALGQVAYYRRRAYDAWRRYTVAREELAKIEALASSARGYWPVAS